MGPLVSGTILFSFFSFIIIIFFIIIFFSLEFAPFPVCTTQFKACLMRLIFFWGGCSRQNGREVREVLDLRDVGLIERVEGLDGALQGGSHVSQVLFTRLPTPHISISR